MRILVLGGEGMAGHMITSYFQQKAHYQVFYTSKNQISRNSIFLDATNVIRLEEVIETIKPDIAINCIGILNEHADKNPKLAFHINSLLPHQLVRFIERYQGRLIQISTDCVFSGEKGSYTEDDIPDGTSIYAQSKQLGEIICNKHLTIRTSIIGPELKNDGIGLFLWFMKQKRSIKGFEKVIWNGVTTLELAKAIESMIQNDITGLYHLGSDEKISKYALLNMIKQIFNKANVEILPDSQIVLDRTITNTRSDYRYQISNYKQMLLELKDWMRR